MTDRPSPVRSRRIFLADLGRATVGLAFLGVAACSDDSPAASSSTTSTAGATPSTSTLPADPSPTSTAAAPETTMPGSSTTTTTAPAVQWSRVDLGNVSAYVVVRGGEAIVVDTGNPGSEQAIADTLSGLGVGWSDVGHVVLTHRHRDHVGSVDAVLALAAAATAHAGAEDIPAINAPREVVAVGDGARVAGLEVVATPGHTPGHICVIDPDLGMLIAGDALIGDAGGVAGPSPRFSTDMALANASVIKLATFEFDVVVFGHGEPVLGQGSRLVAGLASGL